MMKGFAATVLMEWFCSLSGMRGLGVAFAAFKSRVCTLWVLRSSLLGVFFLAEVRSPIGVIFRVYVVLGNLFVRHGIGLHSLSALQQCAQALPLW
jgi:hypothetical protein